MKLIIASNNAHKVVEIRQILKDYFTDICTLREAGIDIDVVEDGATFTENAIKKAEEVLSAAAGFDAALADDSGPMADALEPPHAHRDRKLRGRAPPGTARSKRLRLRPLCLL